MIPNNGFLGLNVTKVNDDGLIPSWNASQQEPFRVRPGDLVVQVNRVVGNPGLIVKEIKTKPQLQMHILRKNGKAEISSQGASTNSAETASNSLNGSREAIVSRLLELTDEDLTSVSCTLLGERPWLVGAVLESQLSNE